MRLRGATGIPRGGFRHSHITRNLWADVHECEMVHMVRGMNMVAVAGALGNSGFDASRVSDHVAKMYDSFVDAIPYFARSREQAVSDDGTDELVREWRRMDEAAKRGQAMASSDESGDDT